MKKSSEKEHSVGAKFPAVWVPLPVPFPTQNLLHFLNKVHVDFLKD
jgi:hypothetical protein